MVHTSSRYFQVLFYNIKHTSYTTLMIFLNCHVSLKKTVANKLVNRTTGAVGDFGEVITANSLSIYSIFQF